MHLKLKAEHAKLYIQRTSAAASEPVPGEAAVGQEPARQHDASDPEDGGPVRRVLQGGAAVSGVEADKVHPVDPRQELERGKRRRDDGEELQALVPGVVLDVLSLRGVCRDTRVSRNNVKHL